MTETTSSKPLAETSAPSKNGKRASTRKIKAGSRGETAASDAIQTIASALASGDLAADLLIRVSLDDLTEQQRNAFAELSAMARSMRRTVGRLRRAADSVEAIARRVLEGGRALALSVGDEADS